MAERVVTAATRRARQMMLGGMVFGHAVGLGVIGLALALGGPGAALTAALGFAAVVVFYTVGQALEVVASEMPTAHGLILVLASYAVRVIGIAGGLWFLLGLPQLAPHVSRPWLAASVAATVVAWVTGVVLVAARQRVPVYDSDYQPPVGQDDD
ncbi:MAG TPA: hypothetical protein PJ992_10340 [Arachnia sp.]|jgi:hypothetical protein|nr:hypothetical protein [Arachnia sp.]HMR14749.1 hypothetical protein [Arachnia sp.]